MKVICIIIAISLFTIVNAEFNETEKEDWPERINEFTYKLYNKLGASNTNNFFISPFSVMTALAMTLVGAKGTTAQELKDVLSLNVQDNELLEMNSKYLSRLNTFNKRDTFLNIANKIYSKSGFQINEQFTTDLAKYFRSEIQSIDFSKPVESATEMNDWVSNKTNNRIQNIIDSNSITDLTRLVLINAIYFKSSWANRFDESSTEIMDFNLNNNSNQVKAQMMKIFRKNFNTQINPSGLNVMSCELPYNGAVSMTILLPNVDSSIEELEKSLTSNHLNTILTETNYTKTNVYVPKFKIQFKSELSGVVKDLGAKSAFSNDLADFSGIHTSSVADEGNKLFISEILHQTFIEVNENGTEAAAATVVHMALGAFFDNSVPLEFKCDRPFMFIIHETLGNGILFIGKLMNPNL